MRWEDQTFTYQTRFRVTLEQDQVLGAYGDLYSRVEHKLFKELMVGGSVGKLKSVMMAEFGLTARQYNAIAIGLRGKISSIKERRSGLIKEAKIRIARAKKLVTKLYKAEVGSEKLHQKKRRLATLVARLKTLKADHKAGKVRLCFGSKKLFRAQFYLEANGYQSHEAWRQEWQEARSSQFYVIGSKDESGGCVGCVATLQEDGSLNLRLRLPNILGGKHLILEGLRFAYGQEQILESLKAGRAISYRFKRDVKGWRVLVSTGMAARPQVSRRQSGSIGVDINSDHLAVSETDRFGNLVKVKRVKCVTAGKSSNQTRATVGEAAKAVVAMALKQGKPIAIEKLDFSKKKAEAEGSDKRANKRLSSFAYSQVSTTIHSAAFRNEVGVLEVNPAFSSVIGAVNHAHKQGISIHGGAALVIARRGAGLAERPAGPVAKVPTGQDDWVTLVLPVRNRTKHVWSDWSAIRTKLRAARRVQDRSRRVLAPRSPDRLALSANRSLRLQEPHVNHLQNGSVGVIDEDLIP